MNRNEFAEEAKYSLSLLAQPQVVNVLLLLALLITFTGVFA